MRPDTLLGFHDPGQPWDKWGCPIDGCGGWFLGPWDLERHTEAEHPDWTATYELLRPYPNQRQQVVYRRSDRPGELTRPVSGGPSLRSLTLEPRAARISASALPGYS